MALGHNPFQRFGASDHGNTPCESGWKERS